MTKKVELLIKYKLTTQDKTTYNGYKLPRLNQWYYPKDLINPPLPCTDTVLHYYADPRLATIFNTIQANINNPRLFKIAIKHECGTDGLKGWSREQKLIQELPCITISLKHKVIFAILCAEKVYTEPTWVKWKNAYLKQNYNGKHTLIKDDVIVGITDAAAAANTADAAKAANTADAAKAAVAAYTANTANAAYAANTANAAYAAAYAANAAKANAAAAANAAYAAANAAYAVVSNAFRLIPVSPRGNNQG